jgi:membrane fusion protein, type I secretion system
MTMPEKIHAMDAAEIPDVNYHATIRLGMWILAIGFGGFVAWAVFAPLDEAVPAQGVVSVESKRKRIDHLAGGIVEKILVQEGQRVSQGQDLVVLNETQAKASFNTALSQWRVAAALEARLRAERDGAKAVQYPKELTDVGREPEVAAAIRAQNDVFRSRRGALEGELAIISESVLGLEHQIQSLDQLVKGRETQVALFNEQLRSFRKLNSDGFVSRNQLLDIERQLAEVQSKQGEDLANISGVRARLAEFRMRGAQRQIEYRREVETQLAETQRDLASLSERLVAQRDTYERLVLRAPVAGTVVDLAAHTIGGVIKPGERILDIVPQGDELVVEAKISPQHVDRVKAGLPAEVHLDAYLNRLDNPVLTGRVIVVSADALVDVRNNSTYYAARVAIAGEELKKLGALELQPGMQGTVMVKTGERSMMTYLLRPLLRRFSTAMKEH